MHTLQNTVQLQHLNKDATSAYEEIHSVAHVQSIITAEKDGVW
jgi:hypothetical protein